MFFFVFFVFDFDLKSICLICYKTKTNNLNLICQYQFNYVIYQRCVFQNNRCDFINNSFLKKQKLIQKNFFCRFWNFWTSFWKMICRSSLFRHCERMTTNRFMLKKYCRRISASKFSIRFSKTCDNIFRFVNEKNSDANCQKRWQFDFFSTKSRKWFWQKNLIMKILMIWNFFFFVISKFFANHDWKCFFEWTKFRYDKSFQNVNLFFVVFEMFRRRKQNHFLHRDDVVENDRFEIFVTSDRKQQNVFLNSADFESAEFFKTNVKLKQFLISIKNETRFKTVINRKQFSILTENKIWIRAKTRQKQFLTKIKNKIKSWIDHKRKFNENVIFFFVEIFLTLKFLFVLFLKIFFFENCFTNKKQIVISFSSINDCAEIFELIFFQII